MRLAYVAAMSSPMLAKGRRSDVGAAYAVTFSTHCRLPLLGQGVVAQQVIDHFRLSDDDGISQTHAWVLMPDHVHWLLGLRRMDLAACVRRLKSRSALAIHQQVGSTGRVWQAGFFDHRVRGEEDLRTQARYIIQNPVRAGLVEHPVEYPYWGCRWISPSDAHLL